MRLTFFTLVCLLISTSSFAQLKIRGKVLDSKKHVPIVSATVTVHPIGSATYLAYCMTDEEGQFVVNLSNVSDSVEIVVRSMLSEPYRKKIRSDMGYVELIVEEKAVELKEVLIKAPKIRQMGDTINYNVSGFIDITDRSIGDVLRKLPGIQVLSTGQILYQNKPISRFYIEGVDMLKGKYGIATKNIEATNVATVQILENHQPIKVLKDMEIPQEAAINLKLKDSARGAFFATAQVGLGLPHWLYNNELVGMRFSRKQQNMLILKNDNTGRDISKELASFYDPIKLHGVKFLSVSSPSSPGIQEQHYLFNRANLVSLNNLIVLNKETTLTANLSFLHDKQIQTGYSEQQVFLVDGEKVVVIEDAQNQLLKRELEGKLVWEVNNKNKYLNNKLKAITKWNKESGILLPTSSNRNNQYLNTPSLNVSDDFEFIIKRGKEQYRLGAFMGYIHQMSSLTVSPSSIGSLFLKDSQIEPVMRQDVKYNQFTANGYFSGSYGENFNISYKIQPQANLYQLNSAMYNSSRQHNMFMADSLQNQLFRKEFGTTLSAHLYWKFSPRASATIFLPLELLYIYKSDIKHQLGEGKFHTLFSPVLYYNLAITPSVQMNVSGGYRQHIADITEDYMGYIMSSYRKINRSLVMQSKKNDVYSKLWIAYRNPFTTLFASFSLNYSHSRSNTLKNSIYDGIFLTEKGIYHPNSSNFFSSSTSIEKNLEALWADVKLSIGCDYRDGMTLFHKEIGNYKTNAWYFAPSISTNITRWMVAKYGAGYTQSTHTINGLRLPTIHSFKQDVTASIIPLKKLVLNMSFNHYYNSLLSAESKSIWFVNLGAIYKMKNMDIILDWTNIFNKNCFKTTFFDNTLSFHSMYQLRPSELLLRVKFKLL